MVLLVDPIRTIIIIISAKLIVIVIVVIVRQYNWYITLNKI
jgi:hypothetical protein